MVVLLEISGKMGLKRLTRTTAERTKKKRKKKKKEKTRGKKKGIAQLLGEFKAGTKKMREILSRKAGRTSLWDQ